MEWLGLLAVGLLTLLAAGHADVQDVTTIFRFRETNAGGGYVPFEECFGESTSCPWYKTGWQEENVMDDLHVQDIPDEDRISGSHKISGRKLSPPLGLGHKHSVSVSIAPASPTNSTLCLYLMADDGDGGDETAMRRASLVRLTLSSNGNHQAHVCLRDQTPGRDELLLTLGGKVTRRCKLLSDMFIMDGVRPQTPDSFYELEYRPSSGEVSVEMVVGSDGEKKSLLQDHRYSLPMSATHLRILSDDGDVSYTMPTPGLLLTRRRGELTSPDVVVTPTASRLCISVGVAGGVAMHAADVVIAVRASDGRRLELRGPAPTGVDPDFNMAQASYRNFVADLKEFENQTVDIQVIATRRHDEAVLFITSIARCKSIVGPHQMTVIHQPARLEIHGFPAADIDAPFILPSKRVMGPNVGVAVECVATLAGCPGWEGVGGVEGVGGWTRRRHAGAGDTPRLEIGLERFSDSFTNEMTASRDFVDALEVSLLDVGVGVGVGESRPGFFRLLLSGDELDVANSAIYVLAVDLAGFSAVTANIQQADGVTSDLKEPEGVTRYSNEPEVVTSDPNEPEVVTSDPNEPEVVTSDPNEPEVVTSVPNDPEGVTELLISTTDKTLDATEDDRIRLRRSSQVETSVEPQTVIFLYKCDGNGKDKVSLTADLARKDCTLLKETYEHLPVDLKTRQLRLEVAIVRSEGGQVIKVRYSSGDAFSPEELVYNDISSPVATTKYRMSSASLDYVFATSQGAGRLFFNLDRPVTDVVSSAFAAPSDGYLCLSVDYLVDGSDAGQPFSVTLLGDNAELALTRKGTSEQTGKWRHERVVGKITFDGPVRLKVTFRKPADGRLLLQRMAFCHREGDAAAIYEGPWEHRGASIFHPGARLADLGPNTAAGAAADEHTEGCQNGGVRTAAGCDCPAGFMGEECQTGCGPNRFGTDCREVCSFTTRGCRGMLLGRPHLGFNCAPGFGGPLCDTPCAEGVWFGAGCGQRCGSCAAGTPCDRYTGECLHGCRPGFHPPRCQQVLIRLTTPPLLGAKADTWAELVVDLQKTAGEGAVKYWQVQYKLSGTSEWLEGEKKKFSLSEDKLNGEVAQRIKLRNLSPGVEYQARVVLLTYDPNRSYQGDDLPELSFTTECQDPSSKEFPMTATPWKTNAGLDVAWQHPTPAVGGCAVLGYEVHLSAAEGRWDVRWFPADSLRRPEVSIGDLLPATTYQVRVRAVTAPTAAAAVAARFSATALVTLGGVAAPESVVGLRVIWSPNDYEVTASWEPPKSGGVTSYDVTYKCESLLACPGHPCEDEGSQSVSRTVVSIALRDLQPHAIYRLAVRASRRGDADFVVAGAEVSTLFRTPPAPSEALASEVAQHASLNTETSVTASWGRPDADACASLHGALIGYHAHITPPPLHGVRSVNTTGSYVTFGGLQPSTEYRVRVSLWTSAGVDNGRYIEVHLKTHAPSPGPVNQLVVYAKSRSSLDLRWSDPNTEAVAMDGYVLTYAPLNGFAGPHRRNVGVNDTCLAWPDSICYHVSKLAKDTVYSVSVHAVSTDGKTGEPVRVEGKTTEEAPGPPLNLRLQRATKSSLSIAWDIPELINGVLRRFVVTVEGPGFGSGESGEMFMSYDVTKIGEKPSYEYQLENLKEDTKYNVSVTAETRDKGPSVLRSFRTEK